MNRIKEIFEEKGIKQTWLAEQLGKSFNIGECLCAKPSSTIDGGVI
jgi:hypothetical protein